MMRLVVEVGEFARRLDERPPDIGRGDEAIHVDATCLVVEVAAEVVIAARVGEVILRLARELLQTKENFLRRHMLHDCDFVD